MWLNNIKLKVKHILIYGMKSVQHTVQNIGSVKCSVLQ